MFMLFQLYLKFINILEALKKHIFPGVQNTVYCAKNSTPSSFFRKLKAKFVFYNDGLGQTFNNRTNFSFYNVFNCWIIEVINFPSGLGYSHIRNTLLIDVAFSLFYKWYFFFFKKIIV